ncbi:MAG: hypothetical protein HC772_03205 [Leptolyngbyaceae cyanobacterium CRU_2_3]|nr:hypothetical protein [Leptolyngbyaceae cyanobacterium CRU_2_3]
MTSSLSRRAVKRRVEATQKLIAFCIQQQWFTLPIQAAERVMVLDQVYGSPDGRGLRFTHYQDRQILVIDAKQRIFGSSESKLGHPNLLGAQPSASTPQAVDLATPASDLAIQTTDLVTQDSQTPVSPTYLLVVRDAQGEPIGIPLESQPTLRNALISAFKPLPAAYLAEGKIRCISALVVPTGSAPALLLLNLDQLLQFQTRSLPPIS